MSEFFKNIEQGMDLCFLDKLDQARAKAGIPFIINSAFRTEERNKLIGGSANSSHLKGLAVDIKATNSRTRFIILEALISVGFNRIGIADTFIHVDLDLEKSDNVIWTY